MSWPVRLTSASGGGTGIIPDALGFPAQFKPQIIKAAGRWTWVINPKAYCPEPFLASALVYYVNVSTGSDTNDGLTPATAFKSIHKAVTTANGIGPAARVYVAAGYYPQGFNLNGSAGTTNPTYPMAFIGTGGTVINASADVVSWPGSKDATYTNCTKATRSSVIRVFDLLDTYNAATLNDANYVGPAVTVYTELAQVADAATCDATVNSWAQVGSLLYVNRGDGLVASEANTRVFLNINLARLTTNTTNLYFENFEFQGGAQGGWYASASATRNQVFVSCSTKYAGSAAALFDGWRMDNTSGLILMVNCASAANAKDGFNFHYNSGPVGGNLYHVTLGCIGVDNGRFTSTSNNGLTGHEDIRGIDVASYYGGNSGADVHYVNTSKLACWGTISRNNTDVADPTQAAQFKASQDAVMWLTDCTGRAPTAGQRNVYAQATNGLIYLHNFVNEQGDLYSNSSYAIQYF